MKPFFCVIFLNSDIYPGVFRAWIIIENILSFALHVNYEFVMKCQTLCMFPPQDEFLDVIYWFRQIIAVILGVIWGIVPLKGFVGIAM